MSYFLINSGDQSIGTNSPLIKSRDRQNFNDAIVLLQHAKAVKTETETAYAAANDRGYSDGVAAGRSAIEAEFLAEMQKIFASIEANEAARHEQIATLAFAAAQAIVGAIDQTDAVRGIVNQVIKRNESQHAITVHLNPEKCEALRNLDAFPKTVELIANTNLGPTDCEIVSANGKIIASMKLQFAALAKRWSVANPAIQSDDI
jgi:flagellar biosynthesis/type III secretory pathway protein FliH